MLLIALIIATAPVNTIVKVEGRAFRVEVTGQDVRVSQKAAFTKVSLKARVRMREAVRLATGCEISDDYWKETDLEGRLDCPSSP